MSLRAAGIVRIWGVKAHSLHFTIYCSNIPPGITGIGQSYKTEDRLEMFIHKLSTLPPIRSLQNLAHERERRGSKGDSECY